MPFSAIFHSKKLPLIAVAGFLLTGILIIFADFDSYGDNENVTAYSREFSQKMAEINPDYRVLCDSITDACNEADAFVLLKRFSRSMFEHGDQIPAFEYLKNCIRMFNEQPPHSPEATTFNIYCYLMLGAAADEVGLRSLSQDYYFKGLTASEASDEKPFRGDFLNNIGVSMLRTGKIDEAADYYNKALEVATDQDNNYLLALIHINLAELSSEKKDYSTAIDLTLKALHDLNPETQTEAYYAMQNAIGDLYRKKGNPQMAMTYLNNAFTHQAKVGNKSSLFDTSLNISAIYEDADIPDSVAKYLAISDLIATETQNPQLKLRMLDTQARIALRNGDMKTAYESQSQILAIRDSIYKEENSTRINDANTIYKIESEAASSQKGIRQWNPVVVFASMGCLVAALAVTVAWLISLKRTNDRLNTQKNRSISEHARQQQKLLDEEKEKSLKIKEDLDIHHRRLISFTLNHLRTNQQVEEIEQEIKHLINEPFSDEKDLKESLKKLLIKLASLKNSSRWEEFQYYFEKVHTGFFTRLDSLHPNLTAKDRRLCALLVLGMNTKEIADITFREVRSVESSRNRLRKKLGLESEANLFEYMMKFIRQNNDRIHAKEDKISSPLAECDNDTPGSLPDAEAVVGSVRQAPGHKAAVKVEKEIISAT